MPCYLLIGLIPLSAEIDKRALVLFGTITRMDEDQTLKKLARRQLSTKSLNSHSWFIYIYKLGLKYDIDIISALDFYWTKDQWKKNVKHAVFSYHKNIIKTEAAGKKTLQNMNIGKITMKNTHIIWPKIRNNGRLNPYSTKAACIRAKLLTSTYMLQSTLAKYYPTTYSSICQLCQKEEESISHFLLECTILSKTRKKCLNQLKKKTLQKADIDVPASHDALIKLILNGYYLST